MDEATSWSAAVPVRASATPGRPVMAAGIAGSLLGAAIAHKAAQAVAAYFPASLDALDTPAAHPTLPWLGIAVVGAAIGAALVAGTFQAVTGKRRDLRLTSAGFCAAAACAPLALRLLPPWLVEALQGAAALLVVAVFALTGASLAGCVAALARGRMAQPARSVAGAVSLCVFLTGVTLSLQDRDRITWRASSVKQLAERGDAYGLLAKRHDCEQLITTRSMSAIYPDPDLMDAGKSTSSLAPSTEMGTVKTLRDAVDAYVASDPQRAFSSGDNVLRGRALQYMATRRDRNALPLCAAAMRDGFLTVRTEAAKGLAALAQMGGTGVLMDCWRTGYAEVRRQAVLGLANIQSREAEAAIHAALKDPNIDVRNAAAVALGKRGDRSAVPVLLEAIGNGNSEDRPVAAEIAGELGGKAAIPSLIVALEDCRTAKYSVPAVAATALGRIGDKRAIEPLRKAIHKVGPDARQECARALERLENARLARRASFTSDI